MTTIAGLRPGQPLTEREREIVEILAGGATNPEIGRRLSLAASTVKGHLQRIGVKAGGADRAGIVGYAIRTGQLKVPVTGAPPAGFAERHFEVLVRIARGASNERIACELWLSVDTVKSRIRRLLELLDVNSRESAVAAGFACGVLTLVPKQQVAP